MRDSSHGRSLLLRQVSMFILRGRRPLPNWTESEGARKRTTSIAAAGMFRLHHCTTAPLHHCTAAPLHRCTTPPLHHSTAAPLHCCTTPLLHCTTTPLHHRTITPPHHHSTAPSLHRTTALPNQRSASPRCERSGADLTNEGSREIPSCQPFRAGEFRFTVPDVVANPCGTCLHC